MSKLAKILDTTPAYLSGWEEEKNKNPKGIQVPVLGKIQAGIPTEKMKILLIMNKYPLKWQNKASTLE